MKTLILNTSDNSGGAAKAAFRLHKELQDRDIVSRMMVQFKECDDNSIIGPTSNTAKAIANIRVPIDHLPKLLYRKGKEGFFHLQWLPDFLIRKTRTVNPDIVHLHWICRGFININSLARIHKPIVWTLHDIFCSKIPARGFCEIIFLLCRPWLSCPWRGRCCFSILYFTFFWFGCEV